METGLGLALAAGVNKDLGTRPGQWLYCEDAMCEVTERSGDEVHLVGLGWRHLNDCRLVE